MLVEERIAMEIKNKGITLKAVSAKSGVPYSKLQPSLKGRRELRADEFLSICAVLNLEPREVR